MHLSSLNISLKVVKHIFSGVIWGFIALYFILMTLIYLPPFQQWMGSKASRAIGDALGTSVSVGSIQLGLPNRIIIDNVTILDQQQKKMLRIGRLSTKLQWLPLVEGRIVISSAQLFGAHINIYKTDSLQPSNMQFVLDALSSNDTTSHSAIDLRINSLIVRHSNVRYNLEYMPKTDRFDLNHLAFNDVSSHILLNELSDDSLNVRVKRLTFNEESGLKVNSVSFSLTAGKREGMLKDFTLQMPHSMLYIDSLTAAYNSEKLNETLRYRASNLNADVRLSDLKCFLPNLANYSDVLSLTTTFEGTTKYINVPHLEINGTGRSLVLNAHGWVFGLDESHPTWKAEIARFSLDESVLQKLKSDISSLPSQLANIGNVQLSGSFEGNEFGDISAHSTILADIGNLDVNMKMAGGKVFSGSLNTKGIDLKRLLSNDHLGTLATNIQLSGTTSAMKANGLISKLEYNDYTYTNIRVDGNYAGRSASGTIAIDDPNAQFTLEGLWKDDGQRTALQLNGTVNKLSPQQLNLSDNWGDATFSLQLTADISATNINDVEGNIDLHHFVMNDSTGFFRIDSVMLQSGFNNGQHYLKLSGDLGEGSLNGQFNLNTLPQSFVSFLASQLPSIPGLPKVKERLNNNFDVNLHITSSEWIRRILNIPLILEEPLSLQGNINDATHTFCLDGSVPAFFYDEAFYEGAKLHISTENDSILCNVNVVKHMDHDLKMDLALKAAASNNNISTSFSWNNHTVGIKATQGELNATTQLYTNDEGYPEAHIRTHSSHLSMGDTQWDIMPSDIIYADNRILVDHFEIQHQEQHLLIDGIASKSAKDTLVVDMKDLDVSYVLDLLNFHPVEFAGFVTGRACVSQLFDQPKAMADINVSSFRFEGGRMGTLHAQAEWNADQQQIDIHALADDGPDSKTHINGYVSPVRSDIELVIKGEGTHIDFLQQYTRSFLSDVGGQAYGEVRLVGPLGAMDLLGTLVVDGQATVIPLGTTYTLKKDTVRLVHNDILLNRANINDINNDVAYLSGGIHHEHLSNLTFDLDIETSRLLAYDFKELGNDTFCGTVEASGRVDLHGRPGEVVINCNATPLRSTVFTYNASLSNEVSRQDFITWRNKHQLANIPVTQTKSEEKPRDIPTDIYINFLINANPNATVKLLMDATTGDYITLYGSGVLRASYHNKGVFQMFGTYTVDHGTYGITIQNIIKKNFVFQEGSTLIFGGNPMEANLQLQAVYTVNGVSLSDLNIGNSFASNTVRVNCLMNITGQAGSPRIDFDFDLPTVNSDEKQMVRSVIASEQEINQQVLYLLGIGRFYSQRTQEANNAETQEYGQTQLAMQSFLSGTLSSQINTLISQVVKNDDWNFGANISTGNEGWHNAEYEGLISGRMLNNRLLINGQFGYRDNATQATSSFIGDFDIRYILIPNGNLSLKMYNQTNDRYFTRSSLNTQGIGLIIKKDFNGLNDLFTRRKK